MTADEIASPLYLLLLVFRENIDRWCKWKECESNWVCDPSLLWLRVSAQLHGFCHHTGRRLKERLLTTSFLSFWKLGVPRPVTIEYKSHCEMCLEKWFIPGSHPVDACGIGWIMSTLLDHFEIMLLTLNPVVPQPALWPIAMSLRPEDPLEYRKGFKNPKDGRPASRRASFNKATNPAKVGHAAEVPPMRADVPLRKILKWSPCAETSG